MVPSQRSREMYAASGARELSGSRERVKPISPHTSRSRALHAPHVPSRMRYVLRAPTTHASISPWRPSGSSHTSRHPPMSSALVRRGIRQQLVGGHERGELRDLRNLLGALYNALALLQRSHKIARTARIPTRAVCSSVGYTAAPEPANAPSTGRAEGGARPRGPPGQRRPPSDRGQRRLHRRTDEFAIPPGRV